MTQNFKFCWPQNFDSCKRFSSAENLTYVALRMRTRIINYHINRIHNSAALRIVLTPLCQQSLAVPRAHTRRRSLCDPLAAALR